MDQTNNVSYNNPMLSYGQQSLHDRYKKINEEHVKNNSINSQAKEGGIGTGNHTSYDNPLIMPDTVLMHKRAGEFSKERAEQEPITRMPKQGGGVSFSNESSQDNPFNTIPQGFKAPQNHISFADEAKQMKAGGGGIGTGNNTSGDNPLLTYNQKQTRGFEQPNQGYGA